MSPEERPKRWPFASASSTGCERPPRRRQRAREPDQRQPIPIENHLSQGIDTNDWLVPAPLDSLRIGPILIYTLKGHGPHLGAGPPLYPVRPGLIRYPSLMCVPAVLDATAAGARRGARRLSQTGRGAGYLRFSCGALLSCRLGSRSPTPQPCLPGESGVSMFSRGCVMHDRCWQAGGGLRRTVLALVVPRGPGVGMAKPGSRSVRLRRLRSDAGHWQRPVLPSPRRTPKQTGRWPALSAPARRGLRRPR
jgi:hypothetical protein